MTIYEMGIYKYYWYLILLKMPNEMQKGAGAEMFAPPAKKEAQPSMGSVAEINNISRAVKIIEDKYENLRKKVQIDEQNSISSYKKVNDELKVVKSDVLDIKRDIADIKEKILLIIKEIKTSAKSEQFQELQKYIEMWDPVNFVTRNEVRKVVEKAMEEKFT